MMEYEKVMEEIERMPNATCVLAKFRSIDVAVDTMKQMTFATVDSHGIAFPKHIRCSVNKTTGGAMVVIGGTLTNQEAQEIFRLLETYGTIERIASKSNAADKGREGSPALQTLVTCCPSCFTKYRSEQQQIGKYTRCKKCGTRFAIKPIAGQSGGSVNHGSGVAATRAGAVCEVCGKPFGGLPQGTFMSPSADAMRGMLMSMKYVCPKCGFAGCFDCCADDTTCKVICKRCGSVMERS